MSGQSVDLETRLKRMIAATGPIDVATYMTYCLSDPEHGYYTTGDPIGAKGDFITAPEISQMFGELVGIYFLSIWKQCGSPTPFHLCELGPGKGTLMADMLRAIRSDSTAKDALNIHLVEVSPSLRSHQRNALEPLNQTVKWHDKIDSLPDAPVFFIANEFFDCLPIHQWVRHQDQWFERVVGLDDTGQLGFGLGALRQSPNTSQTQSLEEGAIWEQSPANEAIMSGLAHHISQSGGAGLFIDYGYIEAGFGDTLQAMRRHAFADPLTNPGKQDLTAHVDFSALRNSAMSLLEMSEHPKALHVPEPITQGEFLLNLGLLERAGNLGAGKSTQEQETIRDAVERLAAPDQMGELFKVLAILPNGISLP